MLVAPPHRGCVTRTVMLVLASFATPVVGCSSVDESSLPLPGDGEGSPTVGRPPEADACAGVEAPFGTEVGDVLDPSLSWTGFSPGATVASDVALDDFVSCSDGGEVQALVIVIDAMWCAVCRDVSSGVAARYEDEWRDAGILPFTVVIEDQDGLPADIEAAWTWRDAYGLEALPVVADPDYLLRDDTPNALPKTLVVDPRTMRIVHRSSGKVDLQPILDRLLSGRTE